MAIPMMVGTYPSTSKDLWTSLTVALFLRKLRLPRDHLLMIVDLLTCAHPHRSGLFNFVIAIAYSEDVTNWFKFRIETAVGRIIPTGHMPVLYVVNEDWEVFRKSFALTAYTSIPGGIVFRAQISDFLAWCVHGIHPTPINWGFRGTQYAFDASVFRACLLCPADPASAFRLLRDEDHRNLIANAEFLTEQMVSITDLKSVRNSCLHRDAPFVKLHFATIANLGEYLLRHMVLWFPRCKWRFSHCNVMIMNMWHKC